MKCLNCGRETTVTVWQRAFPDVNLCRECAQLPDEILLAKIQRKSVAHIIWDLHRKNPELAHHALRELRGTGVPQKPPRRAP
ncbi:Uncharacterised protein [uncultured archaeon]|nr:Uncharacterised protein [uncultured archaeon]